jgi:hypothetical protein
VAAFDADTCNRPSRASLSKSHWPVGMQGSKVLRIVPQTGIKARIGESRRRSSQRFFLVARVVAPSKRTARRLLKILDKCLILLVPQEGLEPPTPSLRMTCSTN